MAGLALGLGACAGSPPPTYDLASPRAGLAGARSSRVIVVSEPTAIAALDSARIVITTSGGELNYLPNGQWSDRLPKLLQVRMIEAFENAHRMAVGRPGDRLVPAAQLNAEIRRFGIDEAAGEAVVEMAIKIVDDRAGSLRAGTILISRVPAPQGTTAAGAAAALDLAAQEMMRQIVAFVARRA